MRASHAVSLASCALTTAACYAGPRARDIGPGRDLDAEIEMATPAAGPVAAPATPLPALSRSDSMRASASVVEGRDLLLRIDTTGASVRVSGALLPEGVRVTLARVTSGVAAPGGSGGVYRLYATNGRTAKGVSKTESLPRVEVLLPMDRPEVKNLALGTLDERGELAWKVLPPTGVGGWSEAIAAFALFEISGVRDGYLQLTSKAPPPVE
jgi:hypothetical protein